MKNKKHKNKVILFISFLFITILCSASINVSAQCAPNPYPSGKAGHSMIYDTLNDVIIVYGGTTSFVGDYKDHSTYDVLAYDCNNNNWTNLNPIGQPNGSSWTAIAYDSESEKLIQFSGVAPDGTYSDDTWIFDYVTRTWTKANPNATPAIRHNHVMAYDSESDVVILHGGIAHNEYNPTGEYIHYNDTWAYDFNSDTWTNMNPSGLDVGLAEAQMVYDSESDRMIMFGGYYTQPYDAPGPEHYSQETWVYDYNSNTWENVTTTIHPDYRIDHALAYDSESDRTILIGGWQLLANSPIVSETWIFDYNTQTWENMNPSSQPERYGHQIAYDSESDLVILFGGISRTQASVPYDLIYTYDYNSNNWTAMSKVLCPTPTPTSFIVVLPMLSLFSILAVIVIRRKRN